jgi:hypothetical protein
VYSADEYAKMRLFLTPDGKAGFALKGDDIVSAFKHPTANIDGFGKAALQLAVQEGGRRLDAFDTVLPALYSNAGFRAVARIKWDESQKPDGWSKETFASYNNGEPDVVFMVYDPEYGKAYNPTDGKYVAVYNDGILAQKRELADIAVQSEMRLVGSGVDKQRVENWRKDLEKQLDTLEKQGKAGTDEWSNINRMEIALGFYLGASEKDRANGHASLTEVHDGNNKLLATVFIQHNPETRVSTIEGIGTLEQAALTKALTHAILHEQAGNKAERIEKVEFADNLDIIAAMEAAGFRKVAMEDPSVVRMVLGKEEKTEAEKVREERIAAEVNAEIRGAALATAKLLGYDPKLIAISTREYTFKIGNEARQRYAAGLAHLDTGIIEIFPNQILSPTGAVSVTTHEIAHQKYETVLKALNKERADMIRTDTKEAEAGRPPITNSDGTLKPEHRDLFPLTARFEKHLATLDKRIRDDGVSDYSADYWKAQKDGPVSVKSASHETIAEMAAGLVDTGKLPGSPQWRAYYNDIMKTYDELKAKK